MTDFNMKKMKALADRIIVKQDKQETKTESGIFLPDDQKNRPSTGTVVAVGRGLENSPVTLKVDDRIIFNANATDELKHNKEEYLILREADVLAITN